MPGKHIPQTVDTVVVGSGPSALILSYILHGNIPYYNTGRPHPDPILHAKLSQAPCLLDVSITDLTAHFPASRLSYSTQALPINVLFDTLIRPLADIDPEKHESCVEWRFEKWRAIPHILLGNTSQTGGQWADNPVSASWDIGALSYAEMLSLPGYAFDEHYRDQRNATVPDFHRPTRRKVANYLAAYPDKVGIAEAIHAHAEVGGICRSGDGFYIASHDVTCKHVVLASGVFTQLITPRPLLSPLKTLQPNNDEAPLLVVGSGFTAADVILSAPRARQILHIYKWDPQNRPSPLRACHPRAYPEYASVYRQMKLAANRLHGPDGVTSPMKTRKSNPFFRNRDWESIYEGLPNTYITDVKKHDRIADVTLRLSDGSITHKTISYMDYVIGRRGSLRYLDGDILREVDHSEGSHVPDFDSISGQTLRSHMERSLEIAPCVYAVGSLTGDSLIRFAHGGCVFAAREIIKANQSRPSTTESSPSESSVCLSTAPSSPVACQNSPPNGPVNHGGHFDLHLDRKIRSIALPRDT